MFTREEAFSHPLHTQLKEAFKNTTEGHRSLDALSVMPPVYTRLFCETSSTIIPSAAPGRLYSSGRALTGPGRLALSGALGIRVDAGSGPGAGGVQLQVGSV